MSRKQTKRARFAAMAKIARENKAAARQAELDLLVFGTCCTYTDGDRLKCIRPQDLYIDRLPSGAHVQQMDPYDQRRIINIWYDELARLNGRP
jgi:hypothetical protein